MRLKRTQMAAFAAALIFAVQSAGQASLKKKTEFSDISDHWSRSVVMRLNGYGIINGYEDGTVRPEAAVSAAEFITVIVKALGQTVEASGGYWAAPYIGKAVELGLIEDGEFFNYNKPITRAEAAKIVANTFANPVIADENAVKAKIYDYAEIDEEFKPYVLIAYDKKIVNGDHNNCFGANRILKRAEAAVMAGRLIDANGGMKMPESQGGAISGTGEVMASAAVYVSPDGNDSAEGTQSAPFKTVAKAKEEVRRMIAGNALPQGGVTVYLRGGTYYIDEGMRFTKEDSGKEGSPITYTAYPGEEVTLSGQIPLEKSWFKPADEAAKKVIIDKKAADSVLVADLKAHDITDYGEMSTRGYHYFNKGRYAQAELIVNDENQTLARYPNDSLIPVPSDSVDAASFGFQYSDDRVSKWKDAPDAYIVGTISINYENNTYPIEKIDTGKKLLTIKEGRINTYYTNGWFFGENMLEEIDREGEYYIDRDEGKLYYYPPKDFSSGKYDIGLSMLKKPMFDLNGASYISVENITMKGGRGYALIGTSEGYSIPSFKDWMISRGTDLSGAMFTKGSTSTSVYIKDIDNYTDAQTFPGHVWDGFVDEGTGIDHVAVKNCNIFNFGAGAMVINGTNISIENNHIKNIGGTGLFLRGGDLETLSPSGNTIINNKIHRVGYLQKAYVPAIAMHGVGIHVAYNDIYDAPHCIFNYHGNDHIIEYNRIHEAVKECLDMDAIYTRNEYMPQWRGNIIRYNYIYDLGHFPISEYTKQLNVSGIRTDNYGHALQIYNNIFADIGSEGANNVIGVTAQGNRNTLKGNIFVDCSATFLGWGSYSAGATWDMSNQEEKERVELAEKYSKIPAFAERYPELATFKNEYYKSVATNVFDENLVVNIKYKLSETNGTVNKQGTRGAPELILGTNNYVTTSDPGFTDYKNGDYSLKADSDVFKKIPGFENIDMTKIGNNAPVGPVK